VTPLPQVLSCFAIVTPGLESFAIAEAQALGLAPVAEPGGFAWQGTAESALLANVGLRIASRVLVRLSSFEARSFAELERHARRIEWARVIAPGESVRFRVTCKKSKLYHSDAVAQRLADAVKRALPGVRAEGSSIGEDDADDVPEDAALIVVRLMRDRCTVSADSSGALLHRRGSRLASTKAPLRETIAAGMLAASGWAGCHRWWIRFVGQARSRSRARSWRAVFLPGCGAALRLSDGRRCQSVWGQLFGSGYWKDNAASQATPS
jgi:Predicted N6-adenine-specific DNA methylase